MAEPKYDGFSYDIYGDLDAELDAAFAQSAMRGIATHPQIVTDGLVTAVGNTIKNNPRPKGLEDCSESFYRFVMDRRKETDCLMSVNESLPHTFVPSLNSPEFDNVDWQKIEDGYKAYEDMGLKPELVIAPEGRPLEFWKDYFYELTKWQADTHPNTQIPKLYRGFTNGLKVFSGALEHWSELVPHEPGWSVSVIPAAAEPPISSVNEQGIDPKTFDKPETLKKILDQETTLGKYPLAIDSHPSIEVYLTLQAMCVYKDIQPLDSTYNTSMTWLKGSYRYNGRTYAIEGTWDASLNNFDVFSHDVTAGTATAGMRPTIKG